MSHIDQVPTVSGPWTVTYFNVVLGKRCVLIDNIDAGTADAVLAKFGNPADSFHYLPELEKLLTGTPGPAPTCPHGRGFRCTSCYPKQYP